MAKRTSTKDNLTKVKGIGPKIQGLLNAKGILTYKDLAAAKMSKLEAILDEAGSRFNLAEPANWIKEAKVLAKSSSATKPKTTTKPKTSKKPKTKPKASTKPKTFEAASKIKVGELDLPRFRKIMRELKDNTEDLTKMTVRKYRKQAKKDADKLLRGMRRDLRRWTRLLEKGDLTTEDFEFLVKSQVASAKMSALESSGLAAIRLEAYRSSMFNMIIDTIFGLALRILS